MGTLTKKQIAAGQRRSLKAIKRKLEGMAAHWCDVDLFCMGALEELAKRVQQLSDDLVDPDSVV